MTYDDVLIGQLHQRAIRSNLTLASECRIRHSTDTRGLSANGVSTHTTILHVGFEFNGLSEAWTSSVPSTILDALRQAKLWSQLGVDVSLNASTLHASNSCSLNIRQSADHYSLSSRFSSSTHKYLESVHIFFQLSFRGSSTHSRNPADLQAQEAFDSLLDEIEPFIHLHTHSLNTSSGLSSQLNINTTSQDETQDTNASLTSSAVRLVDAALRSFIIGAPIRRGTHGIRTISSNISTSLAQSSPHLFCPGYSRALEHHAHLIPNISKSLWYIYTQSSSISLRSTFDALFQKARSRTGSHSDTHDSTPKGTPCNGTEQSCGTNRTRSIIEAKLFALALDLLIDVTAAKKLKPVTFLSDQESGADGELMDFLDEPPPASQLSTSQDTATNTDNEMLFDQESEDVEEMLVDGEEAQNYSSLGREIKPCDRDSDLLEALNGQCFDSLGVKTPYFAGTAAVMVNHTAERPMILDEDDFLDDF